MAEKHSRNVQHSYPLGKYKSKLPSWDVYIYILSVGFLLIPFFVSLAVKKFSGFIKFHLSIIGIKFVEMESCSESPLLHICHTVCYWLCFLLEVSVSDFIFKYFIHLRLLFKQGVRYGSSHSLAYGCPISSSPFVEKVLFSPEYVLHISLKYLTHGWS